MSAAQMVQPQLVASGRVLLGAVANTLLALVLFFVALLIAGFMMANATKGGHQIKQLLGTFADHQRGDEMQDLVVATIRSVSNGVVGVAFMQALALGVGFLILDVPAAVCAGAGSAVPWGASASFRIGGISGARVGMAGWRWEYGR